MMVKASLHMALDFGRRSKKDKEHGIQTELGLDGKWRVLYWGPTYANTYVVTEFDEAGLLWLKARVKHGD